MNSTDNFSDIIRIMKSRVKMRRSRSLDARETKITRILHRGWEARRKQTVRKTKMEDSIKRDPQEVSVSEENWFDLAKDGI